MDNQDQLSQAKNFIDKNGKTMINAMNIFIIIMLFVVAFNGQVNGVGPWFALLFAIAFSMVNAALPFAMNKIQKLE